MKLKTCTQLFVAVVLLLTVSDVHADSYGAYQTTDYYSASLRYFVEVTEEKRATLYLNDGKFKRIWSRNLPELPGDVAVSNDGRRVAVIDRAYGNGGDPSAVVILMLDEKGNDVSGYCLGEVAALQRVLLTTSSAHWYRGAEFTADGQLLVVETFVKKCEGPHQVASELDLDRANECDKAMPYERLRFDAATGKMADRNFLTNTQS